MTKEELKKEAEEFTDSKKSFWRQGRTCIDSVKQAYIAAAEPREKRIAELEATNKRISDECHKLVDSLEKRQKEVAELKNQLRDKKCNDKECPVFIKLVQANKKNAELTATNTSLLESCEGATMMYKDLCKAKEIIRMVIDSYNHKERFSFEKDLMKAEQFLQEDSTYERIQKAKYNYID